MAFKNVESVSAIHENESSFDRTLSNGKFEVYFAVEDGVYVCNMLPISIVNENREFEPNKFISVLIVGIVF